MVALQAVPPPEGAEADGAAVEAVDVEDEEDADGGFFPRTEDQQMRKKPGKRTYRLRAPCNIHQRHRAHGK